MNSKLPAKRTLLVLASTYPRWLNDPEPGFVHELSKRLTSTFHVIVLCPHSNGSMTSEILEDVEIIRYRYAPQALETLVNDGGIVTNLRKKKWKFLLVPFFLISQAWYICKICKNRHIDVIHAHWIIPQGLTVSLLRKLSNSVPPFLVTSHGADLYALKGRIFKKIKLWVLQKSAAATVVSSAMRDTVAKMGSDTTKVSVASMGIDMKQRFTNCGPEEERSSNEILFVGRLVEKKGLQYLIDSMPRILQQIPQAKLTIAGFGVEEDNLKQQVRKLGLSSCISFLGPVPQTNLPELYQRATLLVAPFIRAKSGDEEGLGLVLLEAIACGCPVLVGDVPAIRDVLEDGFDDLIINPLDMESMANTIAKSMQQPLLARARAASLHGMIGEKFDWTHVAYKYAITLSKIADTQPE